MKRSAGLVKQLTGICVTSCLVGGLLLGQARPSWAQVRDDYKVIEPAAKLYVLPTDTKEEKRVKVDQQRNVLNQVREILRDGNTLPSEKRNLFEKWFTAYQFPLMTLYTPEALKEYPEERKKLLRDNLQLSTNREAHDVLVGLALQEFKKIAADDYHPAARYNAMLIIGELNQREMVRSGGDASPPLPLLTALPFMLSEFEKKEQIDTVRVAALLGIQRHVQMEAVNPAKPAEAKIPPATLTQINTTMLALVRTAEPPAGRTQAGHHWMRRRAVEILGWLGAIKPDQQIVDELVKRVADSNEDRGVRGQAVLALREVKYTAPVSVKTREVAAGVGKFIVDSFAADFERIEKQRTASDEALALYGGGMSMGGMGGGSGSGMEMGPGGSGRSRRPSGGGGPPGMRMPPGMMGGPGGMGGGGEMRSLDPYAFRLNPTYRKLRHEIGCALQALRGYDEYRRSQTPTVGIYVSTKSRDDQNYIDELAKHLSDLAGKLKVPEEELHTDTFLTEVRTAVVPLEEAVKTALKGAGGAKRAAPAGGKAAPKAAPEAAPAGDLPDPAGDAADVPPPAKKAVAKAPSKTK